MSVAYLRYKDLVFVVDNCPDEDMAEYYYEEKLCPSDVVAQPLAVVSLVDDFDEDAHGLFEYLGQSQKPSMDYLKGLFKEKE